MASLQDLGLNIHGDEQVSEGSSPILPECEVKMMITSTEVKPTKDGNNQMLVVYMRVLEGPESGTEVVRRLNLWHSNEVARRMSAEELAAMFAAAGFRGQPSDSSWLHDKVIRAEVKVRKNKKGEPENKFFYHPAPGVDNNSQANAMGGRQQRSERRF